MALDETGWQRIAIETQDGLSEVHIVGMHTHPAVVGLNAPLHSLAIGAFGMSRKIGNGDKDWSPDPLDSNQRISDYLDRHYANSLTPLSSTLVSWADYLTLSFTVAASAQYKISTSYLWAYTSSSDDFEAQLLVNDEVCWQHKQEPKEVAGQLILQAYPDLVLPLLVGNHEIKLQFRSGKKNKEAIMKSAGITVERWTI